VERLRRREGGARIGGGPACLSRPAAGGRGPTELPDWRHRTLFFRDPEDNIIEIYAEY